MKIVSMFLTKARLLSRTSATKRGTYIFRKSRPKHGGPSGESSPHYTMALVCFHTLINPSFLLRSSRRQILESVICGIFSGQLFAKFMRSYYINNVPYLKLSSIEEKCTKCIRIIRLLSRRFKGRTHLK